MISLMSAFERSRQRFNDSQAHVSQYFSAAMRDVAFECGGEELAAEVTGKLEGDTSVLHPETLRLMNDRFPGSPERVLNRVDEIAEEARELERRERADIELQARVSFGQLLLRGFRSSRL